MRKKSLAETHPEVAKQWHPTKNNHLLPKDFLPGSSKKAWWKCLKGDDHIYEMRIYNRTSGQGCSICSGRKIVKSNCLATLNPKLAKEWHPTKNKNHTPYTVGPGSNKYFWWKCFKGEDHEWKAQLNSRNMGKGCPICSGHKIVKSNSLVRLHPKLVKEWHPTKNGKLKPENVGIGTKKKVWWICSKVGHEFYSLIYPRTKGGRCPICFPGGYDQKLKGYLYTHLIYHESGKKIALKFGITNIYGRRIKDLRSALNLYSLKNLFYFEGGGTDVLRLENKIKRKFKTRYLNSEIMSQGHTETIKYSDKTLVEIYNLCNKELKFKSGKKLYMKRLLNIFN